MTHNYQRRDELASQMVSVWQDAIAFKFTQSVVLAKFGRIRETSKYKRLPQYMHAYISGFERCYQLYVVERTQWEHGAWVRMPDGTEKWFGTSERVHDLNDTITYRYIYENRIPEKSGIYWIADLKCGTKSGQCPYFLDSDYKPSEQAA